MIAKIIKKFFSFISSLALGGFLYVGLITWFGVCIVSPIFSLAILCPLYIFMSYQRMFRYKFKTILFPKWHIMRVTIFSLISLFFIYAGNQERLDTGTNEILNIDISEK